MKTIIIFAIAIAMNTAHRALAFWEPGKIEYEKGRFAEAANHCLMILDMEKNTVRLSRLSRS